MNFPLAFAKTLLWRPHRALAALYWYATGRKVRARNRLRLAVAQASNAYTRWIDTIERLDEVTQSMIQDTKSWKSRPRFSVLIYLDPAIAPKLLDATIQSVRMQTYDEWELLLSPSDCSARPQPADDARIAFTPLPASNAAQALNIGISAANGDYILPLQSGDRLSPAALLHYAQALQKGSRPTVLYGDDDRLNWRSRRTRPWFKPDWNEEMFLAQDYISSACIIHAEAAKAVDHVPDDLAQVATYAMLLQIVTSQDAAICHIPHILCHRIIGDKNEPQAERIAAVARHLEGRNAQVLPGPFGSVNVAWPLPTNPPLVSIVIPTRDKVHLLRACVDSVLTATRYPRFELLIVDNGSVEPATHHYMDTAARDPRVRILPYSSPYNYSAINNFAVSHVQGDYLCLLNNDTEVLTGDWLTEMMRHAVRPHVGAVGAKLLYADGSIQHAGVVIGLGEAAGHAHRFLRKGRPGYFNQAHIPQYMSAITAACLVVEKRKFDAVGGLDADNLAIAFNDVDLCLKLGAAGWRNVYAPQAVLIHHESKSRGKDFSPQHIERYMKELAVLQERWGTKTYADPLHNPNLNRAHENFTIRL